MNPLAPVTRYLNRDSGAPDVDDYLRAGFELVDGNVFSAQGHIGLASEFGIVGKAWDKKAGVMKTGRFLVQWTEIDGEVLHFAYPV